MPELDDLNQTAEQLHPGNPIETFNRLGAALRGEDYEQTKKRRNRARLANDVVRSTYQAAFVALMLLVVFSCALAAYIFYGFAA